MATRENSRIAVKIWDRFPDATDISIVPGNTNYIIVDGVQHPRTPYTPKADKKKLPIYENLKEAFPGHAITKLGDKKYEINGQVYLITVFKKVQ